MMRAAADLVSALRCDQSKVPTIEPRCSRGSPPAGLGASWAVVRRALPAARPWTAALLGVAWDHAVDFDSLTGARVEIDDDDRR